METIFGWLVSNVLWQVAMSGTVRAAVKWLFRKTLDRQQEIAFWVTVPGIFLLATLGTRLWHPAPDLHGRIDRISLVSQAVCEPPSDSGLTPLKLSGTSVFVAATIRNLGSPSAIEDWGLDVDVKGTHILTRPVIFPSKVTAQIDSAKFSYSPKMALYNRGATPLPTGGIVQGLLIFDIANVAADDVKRPGTRFTLHYKDVTEYEYSVPFVWPEVVTGFNPLPWLEGDESQ